MSYAEKPTEDKSFQVLSESEAANLWEWALLSNPGRMLEDDLKLIFDRACEARLDAALLSLVLERKVSASVKNGEVAFHTYLSGPNPSRIGKVVA